MNIKFSLIFVWFLVDFIDLTVLYANELSFKDTFNLHHAFVIDKFKWDDGLISFKIETNFTAEEIRKILDAMYEIEISSCIRFEAHNPINGPNYVMIRKSSDPYLCGCTDVGCHDVGEQDLWITSGCIDSILHMLLHTIGFNHHQQRSDSHKYIAFHRENANLTDVEFQTNFAPKIEFDERVKNLTPFDYQSVMLYDEFSFSFTEGQPVMSSTVEGVKIQPLQVILSKYDKVLLNRFYNCESVDKRKSSIFYEDEFGFAYPPVINYHEIARAEEYSGNMEINDVVDNDIVEGHEGAVVNEVIQIVGDDRKKYDERAKKSVDDFRKNFVEYYEEIFTNNVDDKDVENCQEKKVGGNSQIQ